MNGFVNAVDFSLPVEEKISPVRVIKKPVRDAEELTSLLGPSEVEHLLSSLSRVKWTPTSIHGMTKGFRPGMQVGSGRASLYSQELADRLWKRLLPILPKNHRFESFDRTDQEDHEQWQAVGVNPLFRFIRYAPGGGLVVHRDAPYVATDNIRSLKSLIIYLKHESSLTGGATRFIRDSESNSPIKVNLEDWPRWAQPEEVSARVLLAPGRALLFSHRLLHDGEPATGTGEKIIMRSDLLFKKMD